MTGPHEARQAPGSEVVAENKEGLRAGRSAGGLAPEGTNCAEMETNFHWVLGSLQVIQANTEAGLLQRTRSSP